MAIRMRWGGRPLRVLDFDCESRPLSWISQDYTSTELTAIGCAWTDDVEGSLRAWVLGHPCSRCGHNDGDTLEEMLDGFAERWAEADMVTGHNIHKYDLKRINGSLLELGRPPLGGKLIQDTYRHLKRRGGVSASQASLAEMLNVPADKVGMGQKAWRQANRLLPEGLERTYARVTGDVIQHALLRSELLERGWLHRPQMWTP